MLGEIVLIFVAINLTIWFNNWNSSRQAEIKKSEAVANILQELETNLEQLLLARESYLSLIAAKKAFDPLYEGITDIVVTYPGIMDSLQNQHPQFFRVVDSVRLADGRYRYKGGTRLSFDLPDLSAIAWETTVRFPDISGQFSFQCLYDLERIYNLQSRIVMLYDEAVTALRARDVVNLLRVLDVLRQLDDKLETDMAHGIKSLATCAS